MSITENEVNKKKENIDLMNEMATKGKKALEAFYQLDQQQVDRIVKEMAVAGLDKHMYLAKLAVEETGRGVYEDKIIKNIFSTEYIYNNIKYDRTVGIIRDDDQTGIVEIADPIGVIAGVTPVTNPTSTTMFKAIIAIKTRNPIIFAFHPSAQKCSSEAARILRDAAVEAGAPKDCIQWIEKPSIEMTQELMNHPEISLILATGGPGMVKSAYSSGKPALGVGPGNVPCYIEKSAKIKRAVNDLILSKTFDNGMICASEQAVIIDKEIYNQVKNELIHHKCYFLNEEERKKVEKLVINEATCAVNPNIVGKSASYIAKLAGVEVPKDTKVLLAELEGVGADFPLSREKLSPVLACYKVKSTEEGIKRAEEMLD